MQVRATIQRGSTGDDVSRAQQALIRAGFRPGEVDGTFGDQTEAAVRAFQAVHLPDVDGIVGEATWQELPALARVAEYHVPVEPPVCTTDYALGGRIRGGAPFEMRVDFDGDSEDCECSCGEYRQFVRGTISVEGDVVNHLLPVAGGEPVAMLPRPGAGAGDDNFREDGAIVDDQCQFYGHRDSATGNDDPNDRYLTHRDNGCDYHGSDFPGWTGVPGAVYSIDLDFRGQAIDVCNGGNVLETSEWTVTCAGTLH